VAAPPPTEPAEAEATWEALQEEAGLAWRRGETAAAATAWSEALALAEAAFPEADLRRATSLANHGAGLRALGQTEAAGDLLARAQAAWASGDSWVAALPQERRARSSLFHLRLERRHPGGYAAAAKRRHEALAQEGMAALQALCEARPARDRLPLWQAVKKRSRGPARRLQAACWLLAVLPEA